MRPELREYILWRAGYHAGEKPDRTKLIFLAVEFVPARHSLSELLARSGFTPGSKPDHADILVNSHRYRLMRQSGWCPDFPTPYPACAWQSLVKRSAWDFFGRHCPGLQSES